MLKNIAILLIFFSKFSQKIENIKMYKYRMRESFEILKIISYIYLPQYFFCTQDTNFYLITKQ